MTQVREVPEPLYAAEAISYEIQKFTRFCIEDPPVQDKVPMWTLVSNGMQITWAMLLLERAMKQLLCFDGKGDKVRNNHDVQQPYAELDGSTKTYVEKAFDAYLMLYPDANWKGHRQVPTTGYFDMNAARMAYQESPERPVGEFYRVEPTAVYKGVGSLMAALSSQKRYDMWRYPEFYYPDIEMDMTNVHLILEIASAVSDVLLLRTRGKAARSSNLVGWRLQASFRDEFSDKLEKLMLRLEKSSDDALDLPDDVIKSWQDEHGGFLRAFVDYLLRRPSTDVYRHKRLNDVLYGVIQQVSYSKEPENIDMRQFLLRVRQDDFDLNVLMMR